MSRTAGFEADERSTVTITISREDAEHYAKPAVLLEQLQPYLLRLHDACRAALEGGAMNQDELTTLEDWQEWRSFEVMTDGGQVSLHCCPRCAAVVVWREDHINWHKALEGER